MDPVRNPYAPGAGQRPPELAGRDAELNAFDVALERVERGRPERSLVLTGLRGVGKTVLLNALRSQAMDRRWGTGKVEARPDTSLRRPLTSALHAAVRELSVRHRAPDRVAEVLAVLKAFGLRANPRGGKLVDRWTPAIDGLPAVGRADSGDMEIDLLELLTDVADLATDVSAGVAVVHRRDAGPDAGGRVGTLRGLSRAVPDRRAADAGGRWAAAPAERVVGVEVLLRAAVPLHPDRPAGLGGRGAGAAGAGETGGRDLGAGRADRDGGDLGRLPLLRPGVRQGGLGPRAPLPDHRRRRRRGGTRGRGRTGRGVLRLALRAGDPGRAGLPAGHGRTDRRARRRTRRSRPPTWPPCSAASPRRSPPPATRC